MTVLPEEIPTGLVTGQYLFVSEDAVDADTDPELVVVDGTVTFTCSTKTIRIPTKKVTLVPREFKAKFNNLGQLVSATDGSLGVELPATDSTLTNPTAFTWKVSFDLVQVADRHTVRLESFNIQVPEGVETDLTLAAPVDTSPGILTVQGPRGPEGPASVVPGPEGPPGPVGPILDGNMRYRGAWKASSVQYIDFEDGTLPAGWAQGELSPGETATVTVEDFPNTAVGTTKAMKLAGDRFPCIQFPITAQGTYTVDYFMSPSPSSEYQDIEVYASNYAEGTQPGFGTVLLNAGPEDIDPEQYGGTLTIGHSPSSDVGFAYISRVGVAIPYTTEDTYVSGDVVTYLGIDYLLHGTDGSTIPALGGDWFPLTVPVNTYTLRKQTVIRTLIGA